MTNRILTLALSILALLTSCSSTGDSGLPYYRVEGAVAISGEFTWHGDITLFEAVMQAKPTADRCDLTRVQLLRSLEGEPLTLTVDVQHMYDTGDSTLNVKVLEGDVIEVPFREGP